MTNDNDAKARLAEIRSYHFKASEETVFLLEQIGNRDAEIARLKAVLNIVLVLVKETMTLGERLTVFIREILGDPT